jgi:hypothetical protein
MLAAHHYELLEVPWNITDDSQQVLLDKGWSDFTLFTTQDQWSDSSIFFPKCLFCDIKKVELMQI